MQRRSEHPTTAAVGVDCFSTPSDRGVAIHQYAVKALGGVIEFQRAFEEIHGEFGLAAFLPMSGNFADGAHKPLSQAVANRKHPPFFGFVAEKRTSVAA